MSFGDELVIIRRFLRDPAASIWSDAFLRHLYNDVQNDFQHKTVVLEDVTAQRVPQTYQMSYQHDWEWAFLPDGQSQFYQCLNYHDDGVFCHRWEPQQSTGVNPDVADYGTHFTQPWEGCMVDVPGDVLQMRFPHNFNRMRFIAYDEEPIDAMTQKQVQSADPSWFKTEGEPIGYYPRDAVDNSYVLYPKPSVSFSNEAAGEGAALFADGDTEDVSVGTIAVRSGSSDLNDGSAVDIVDATNSVFMIYEVAPVAMRSSSDESDYPSFLRKYIRYGVIGRAYSGNTDGRIRSLGELWEMRYAMGVQAVKRYLRNRRNDRDYRLTTKTGLARRTYRHPRLPDGYPACP